MVYVYEQPEAQVIIMKCSSGFTVWLVKIIPYGWRQAGKNDKGNTFRVILDPTLVVIPTEVIFQNAMEKNLCSGEISSPWWLSPPTAIPVSS